MFEVVVSQPLDPASKLPGVENLNESLNSFFKKGRSIENHIEVFSYDRYKTQTQKLGNGDRPDPNIRFF